jgi:anti-anti-sigma regulatory factor
MKSNFSLKSRKTDQNLYINISGCFDGSSAWELINTINRKHDKNGKVYIDTNNIREVAQFGKNVLATNVDKAAVKPKNLFFTGRYYKYLMPEGCRYYRKRGKKTHVCSGNCRDCTCNYKQ